MRHTLLKCREALYELRRGGEQLLCEIHQRFFVLGVVVEPEGVRLRLAGGFQHILLHALDKAHTLGFKKRPRADEGLIEKVFTVATRHFFILHGALQRLARLMPEFNLPLPLVGHLG